MRVRLFLLSLVFLLVACGGRTKPDTTDTVSATAILRQATEALERTQSFHFLLEHENGTTPIVFELMMERAEGDILKPDRMQADIIARLRGITARSRVVSIGDRAWITNPFTQMLQPLPGGTTIAQLFDPAVGVRRVVEGLQEPRVAGSERVDGVDAYIVEGRVDARELTAIVPMAEPGQTVQVRAWIGKTDALPRRLRLEGPFTSNEPATILRKLSLSKFNEPVIIETPP